MQTWKRKAFFALVAVLSGHAYGQPSEEEELALAYGDKATISLATGARQAVSRAPSTATVITSHDIEAMGATSLEQALASVPGLHVSTSHQAQAPLYEFRGIATRYNPQVLMLVNGIPITNVFWGDRSQVWGGMPLENVARIEIIRGPGSALYGADAFSGVINVITKNADDIKGTEYGVRAGSFNSYDAWIQHGGKLGTLDAAFYLGVGDTDGHKRIVQKDVLSNSGPISAQRKGIDARADLSREEWRFRAGYQQRELGMGAGVAGSLDPIGRGHATRRYLDLNYDKANWAPNWDVSAVAGYYDIKEYSSPDYLLFPPGTNLGAGVFADGVIGGPGHAERHGHASLSAFYTGFEHHRLRLGAGHRLEDMFMVQAVQNFNAGFAPIPMQDTSNNLAIIYMRPHKRNLSYVFAQDEWSFAKDWTLTAGVRHDKYSDFGGTTNPRLALVWDAAYNVVVKAMHGQAFRAPSFSELYSINNPVVIGSASIRPETIKTDELAVAWQLSARLQTSVNFFRYRMSDIILARTGSTYQNAGTQTGRGLELEATLDATSSLRLTGNLSVQHSTDEATGQDAGMAPHRRLFGRADWRFAPQWQLGATVNRVEDRMREPGDTRAQIPDYTTVDLTLRREKLAGNWTARAAVTNLFNQDAREPTFKAMSMTSDLPLSGRAAYIQLEHKL